MLKQCAEIWDEVRVKRPLVHCITNYVTINAVANVILASGASPAMAENPSETRDFAAIAQALYLNVGTLTNEQQNAMLEAIAGAASNSVPVIVDPVACGVIPYRMRVITKLSEAGRISCFKGNIAEIKHLAGVQGKARGVDSLDTGEGLEQACLSLAKKEQLVVAATGETDVVADPYNAARLNNGTPLFGYITGAGCMVGGVVAACMGAVPAQPWLAAVTAITAFNIAGERAAKTSGDAPGTFHSLLFDKLYQLRGKDIEQEARIDWITAR
ncbi:MAG: hydroxyethylthiazole kinase [Syntrophomonadaceae bacterium]|jgi:hydroxyethylthiazole kinase